MQNRGAGPGPVDTRNMLIAIGLSLAIMLGFEFFYIQPQRAQAQAERARIEAQQAAAPAGQADEPPAAATIPRERALADTSGRRIMIDTPAVDGTILLEGARLDDLNLRNYRRTVDDNSPEVTLLSPYDAEHGHDAFFGWESRDENLSGVGVEAPWQAAEGARLTPETPLSLTVTTPEGLSITRTIAVDSEYMFTITDVVLNASDAARDLRPFGVVRRRGLPEDYVTQAVVHQGFGGAFGPNSSLHNEFSYKKAEEHARNRQRGRVGENERLIEETGPGGWLGLTDHYWLTALVPDQSEQVSGYFDATRGDDNTDTFRAAYRGDWRSIPAGGSVTYTQRLFAGAKRIDILKSYQESLAIPRFDDAIDWGMFWFLTRPFFLWLLHPLAQMVGSFGIAILLSTVVVKIILFPLVYHSYKEMAKMRAVQPKMKEIQERFAADKQRQQQEMIKLYQTEKVNPVSGCMPLLLQIPVFFALYKTLSVTIEMRHAPFFGWINDLSARDPTNIFNLFGLLPFEPHTWPLVGGLLWVGVWPLLYGVTMWAVQALSPPPTDPVQAQIFRFIPILFTVMFAAFPAGLVIYWTWSNTLTFLQQYVIMRRQGVETQLDQFIARKLKQTPAS